jgi:DNA-directed RNA polymerase specialized sigma24 family protein
MTNNRGKIARTHVCSALDAEWRRIAASATGRAATRRWAEDEPALASTCSGDDVVARCQLRDGHQGDLALGAVLRMAVDDEFARQTVIQVILPGLLGMSHRAGYMVGASGGRWADHDELEQEILTIAFERISALAGTTQVWPARTLLDQTWRRLRLLHDKERQRGACRVPMECYPDLPTTDEPSPAEELAQVVVDAVRAGTLTPGVAAMFYTCRVLGHSIVSIAPTVGRDPRTISRWIARSLSLLKAAL